MERVIEFFGQPVCDNCKQKCVERVYDTKTIMGPWANLCSKCNSQIGVGNAEPFVWNESHNAFIKIKHVSDQAQFLSEALGLDIEDAEACL